jgi:hypothetical protein
MITVKKEQEESASAANSALPPAVQSLRRAAPSVPTQFIELPTRKGFAWRSCTTCKRISMRTVALAQGPTCRKCLRLFEIDNPVADAMSHLQGKLPYKCVTCHQDVALPLQLLFDQMANEQCFICYQDYTNQQLRAARS